MNDPDDEEEEEHVHESHYDCPCCQSYGDWIEVPYEGDAE